MSAAQNVGKVNVYGMEGNDNIYVLDNAYGVDMRVYGGMFSFQRQQMTNMRIPLTPNQYGCTM